MEHVVVIGASPNPERYSNKAVAALKEHGHSPVPVTKGHGEIEGIPAFSTVKDVNVPVDTVTVYVRPEILDTMAEDIIEKKPARLIMNPGTENEKLRKKFEDAGITVIQACTLVMLSTGQF